MKKQFLSWALDQNIMDALLAKTDCEEALSRAYVQAIAARAGYTVATMDFDRDGVDLQLRAGGAMRPCVDVQLKATINLENAAGGAFRYALKRRNYDLLRISTLVPRILVILRLPKDEMDWLDVKEDQLILRHAAYWAALAGMPETDNMESITITIYQKNIFNVQALQSLMEQSRSGALS